MGNRGRRWLGWLLLVTLAALGWWAYASWRHGSNVPGATRASPVAGATTVGALTETVDLLPTVFDAFRIAYPRPEVQGRSLLPLIAGVTNNVHDDVFCRSDGNPPSYLVRSLDHALILYGNGKWRALYDLNADPAERRNVIAEQPEQAGKMLAAFEAFAHAQRRPPLDFLSPRAALPPAPRAPEHTPTPEMRRQLRGLGYLR